MMMQRFLRLALLSAMSVLPQFVFAEDDKPEQKNPEELFRKLDKNNDGKLTANEVSDEQRKFFEHLLRVADGDKNGELSKDEFQKGIKPDDAPLLKAQDLGERGQDFRIDPKQQFERLDANKDGKLTQGELPDQAKERLKPLFEKLGKTELTQEEFIKITENSRRAAGKGGDGKQGGGDAAERFKYLDSNQDGKLTLDELPEQAKVRLKPVFDKLGRTELTQQEFLQVAQRGREGGGDRKPGEGKPRDGKPGERKPDGVPQGDRNPHEMFQKLDGNKDGKLTRDEVPEVVKGRFDKMLELAGKGKDGSLSLDEFVKFGEQTRGERGQGREGAPGRDGGPGGKGPGGPPNPEAFFNHLDANKDGKVTLDEVPDRARPMVERMLEKAGKGRDGTLTLDEFKKFPPPPPPEGGPGQGPEGRPNREGREEARGGPPGGPRQGGPGGFPLFRKLDTNGDGRISKDELSKISQLFDELDTNKDGQLDPHEMMPPPPGGRGPGRGEPGREGPPDRGEPGRGEAERKGDQPERKPE